MENRYWDAGFLRSRDTVWMKRPASLGGESWKTALPLGNGVTGALLYGAVGSEILRLTRHDLWAGAACTGQLPDVSAVITVMRQKMDQNDWPAAQNLLAEALQLAGYRQPIPEPFPLGQLRISAMDIDAPFQMFRRGIQLNTAEAFVRWYVGNKRSLRRCFVSQNDGLIWVDQQDDMPRKWEFSAEYCPEQGHLTAQQIKDTANVQLRENILLYTAQVDGCLVGFAARIIPGKDTVIRTKDGYFEILGSGFSVKVYTFAGVSTENIWEHCIQKLNDTGSPARETYENALQLHTALWQSQYTQVQLQLADENEIACDNAALLDQAYDDVATAALYEKLWRFSRYLFLSGTAENGNPFPLYGLWAGDYGLPWTQHVANENVQMIYSPALAGGCFAAYRALIRYYTGYMDLFRENAQKLFGCRGIFVPAYTAPHTLDGKRTAGPSVPVPVILHWISGAGWLAAGFYEYYLYTGDEDMLRSDILPFLLETARFYLDYVKWDASGHCRIYPSVSPENTPGNLMPPHFQENMGHICPAVENATMDFAVMKQVLTQLLALLARPELKALATQQEYDDWQRLLDGIPPYRVDKTTGAVCEWMHDKLDDFNFHRHVSHLYPVFPGREIRRDNAPRLLHAFELAAKQRILGSKSGWAFAHMAALWARLGDGNAAVAELDLLCKACLLENFFTLHNDWRHMGASLDLGDFAPVQLDALMGAANALQEMLVCATKESVAVLCALPHRFAQGSFTGIYLPQGRMDIKWSAGCGKAVLYPAVDAPLSVFFPDESCQKVQLQVGCTVQFEFALTKQ